MFAPLCEAWPLPPSGCGNVTASPPVTGVAAQAASEYLWALSGFQFGTCTTRVRPCRQSCVQQAGMGSWPWAPTWWSGGWPPVQPGSTLLLDAACGRCPGSCDCGAADTLWLPDAVAGVDTVTIDGTVLPPSGYGLYNGRLLVRQDGGRWPMCQDWGAAAGQPGTWTVDVRYGSPVPSLGVLAMGQVFNLFVGFCSDGVCKHPRYLQQRSRQGDTQVFPTVDKLAEAGLTGLALVDDFLQAFAPRRGRDAKIWNPDEVLAAGNRTGGN
jgi:hypothetical protein